MYQKHETLVEGHKQKKRAQTRTLSYTYTYAHIHIHIHIPIHIHIHIDILVEEGEERRGETNRTNSQLNPSAVSLRIAET